MTTDSYIYEKTVVHKDKNSSILTSLNTRCSFTEQNKMHSKEI
jgi:hypothetical protein